MILTSITVAFTMLIFEGLHIGRNLCRRGLPLAVKLALATTLRPGLCLASPSSSRPTLALGYSNRCRLNFSTMMSSGVKGSDMHMVPVGDMISEGGPGAWRR